LRCKQNVEAISAYHIDLDGRTDDEVESVFSNLDKRGLVFAAWTTFSNGFKDPEKGARWRILVWFSQEFPVDDPKVWSGTDWEILNKELALGLNDPSIKDPSRSALLPCVPKSGIYEGKEIRYTPLIWRESPPEATFFDPHAMLTPKKSAAIAILFEKTETRASKGGSKCRG
jgi:hypothetical protein